MRPLSFALGFLAVGSVGLFFACVGDSPTSNTDGGTPGNEGQPCFENGTCNDGLTCISKVCVRLDGGGPADGGDASADGTAADSASDGGDASADGTAADSASDGGDALADGAAADSAAQCGADAGNGLATVVTGMNSPRRIAVDCANVYWTADAPDGGGTVMRCAKGGCGGSPTTVVSLAQASAMNNLAVDGTSVYWTDRGAGTVTRLTPK